MVKAISDLEEMQLKSLYEAEIVSNRLFNNETAFRDNIIQVRLIILRINLRFFIWKGALSLCCPHWPISKTEA